MWRDRQFQQQGLADLLPQIESPTIVKHHVIVSFELNLVAPGTLPRLLRENIERDFKQQLVLPEATETLKPRYGPDLTTNRDAVTVALDAQISVDAPGPTLCGQPNLGCLRLEPGRAGPLSQVRKF